MLHFFSALSNIHLFIRRLARLILFFRLAISSMPFASSIMSFTPLAERRRVSGQSSWLPVLDVEKTRRSFKPFLLATLEALNVVSEARWERQQNKTHFQLPPGAPTSPVEQVAWLVLAAFLLRPQAPSPATRSLSLHTHLTPSSRQPGAWWRRVLHRPLTPTGSRTLSSYTVNTRVSRTASRSGFSSRSWRWAMALPAAPICFAPGLPYHTKARFTVKSKRSLPAVYHRATTNRTLGNHLCSLFGLPTPVNHDPLGHHAIQTGSKHYLLKSPFTRTSQFSPQGMSRSGCHREER